MQSISVFKLNKNFERETASHSSMHKIIDIYDLQKSAQEYTGCSKVYWRTSVDYKRYEKIYWYK